MSVLLGGLVVSVDIAVLHILTGHHGRNNPITSRRIADEVGIPERKVRIIIREWIKTFPIAAATEAPAGYFIAETQEEVNQYVQSLRNRLIEDAKRRRDFLQAARTKVEPRQLEMIA